MRSLERNIRTDRIPSPSEPRRWLTANGSPDTPCDAPEGQGTDSEGRLEPRMFGSAIASKSGGRMTATRAQGPWQFRLDATPDACVPWRATTLRTIGRGERFLEEVIAANPSILGLEDLRTHVRGRYVKFRQLSLDTPQGRSVRPDVVFLTESGHVVVVEAKLCDNPELSDRRVVAQLLDYASSLSEYSVDELADLFGATPGQSFAMLIETLFPGAANAAELAALLADRMRSGELHLIIACDLAPEGLRESVRGIARQASLGGFELRVVELVPHVRSEAGPGDELLFVPRSALRTEIVARTAVRIEIAEGQAKPGVTVSASSPEEVENAIQDAREETHEMSARLAAVIQAYDASAAPELRTRGTALKYRQVRVPGWPRGIHYELCGYGQGSIGVELHLENDRVRPLQPLLQSLVPTLRKKLEQPNLEWEPTWTAGCGRIMLRLASDEPPAIAAVMKRLIDATRPEIDEQLRTMAVP
jgi:hypothetical protein